MGLGRPKQGVRRGSEHARLNLATKRKVRELAKQWGVSFGDALDKVAGKNLDRVHARVFAGRTPPDLGGEGG